MFRVLPHLAIVVVGANETCIQLASSLDTVFADHNQGRSVWDEARRMVMHGTLATACEITWFEGVQELSVHGATLDELAQCLTPLTETPRVNTLRRMCLNSLTPEAWIHYTATFGKNEAVRMAYVVDTMW